MVFAVEETPIPGCRVIRPRIFGDDRGRFVNLFTTAWFGAQGMETAWDSEFYSRSRAGVVRGLHFQRPPATQAKLVNCVSGRILDAVVDLRAGSPAYGRHFAITLDAEESAMIYVPAGLAHGFYVPEGEAIVVYRVSAPYSPPDEGGILWNSAGIEWGTSEVLLAPKDRTLPALAGFQTPFRFKH